MNSMRSFASQDLRRAMANASVSAYYGKGKNLRDNTWQGVGADIQRRLACGDLNPDLRFLSFADRVMTTEGWIVLTHVLHQLSSCSSLDLQRCGIKDIDSLIRMLPHFVHKTKCFNLGGNTLSTRSVRKIMDCMTAAYAHVRPSWLGIGADAQAGAMKSITKSACNPHHPRGCLCSKPSVVHVVRCLPKFNRVAQAEWESEHLRPVEQSAKEKKGLAKPLVDPPLICHMNWPTLPISIGKTSSTPSTQTPSGGDSPNAQRNGVDCVASTLQMDAFCSGDACKPYQRVPATTDAVGRIAPALLEGAASRKKQQTIDPDPLMAYVSSEKRAHEVEMMCNIARLCDILVAPLEAAARFARSQACIALAALQADRKLNCWLLGERMLLLAASAEGRLVLVDLTESASRGDLVDAHGAPACGAYPLRDFDFRATALRFEARSDQHELATKGGELLEINQEHTTHLAAGWVAARHIGASAYLWFPLDYCQIDFNAKPEVA
jgi:hypothetical protein